MSKYMNKQNSIADSTIQFTEERHDTQKSINESAYGGYETLRSVLIDDEALLTGHKALEEVKVVQTATLMKSSGGDGT